MDEEQGVWAQAQRAKPDHGAERQRLAEVPRGSDEANAVRGRPSREGPTLPSGPQRRKQDSNTQGHKEVELVTLVEATLERGDLAPLVRYVFEGQDTPGQAKRSRPAPAEPARNANASLAAMKKVLHQVMVQEKAAITDWCSRNAKQMQGALESVAPLQEQASRMEQELLASHQRLRKAGQEMVQNMSELQEAVRVAAHVGTAHAAVARVAGTVLRLVTAARHVQADDLHLALNIINSLQKDNEFLAMYPLPPREQQPQLAALSKGEYDLLNLTTKATHGVLRAVRKQAQRNFHDWLASTRDSAKAIGERAVRRASADRAHEELLGHERKMLQGMLLKERNLKAAKMLVLEFIAAEDPSHGRSSIKHKQDVQAQGPAVSRTASNANPSAMTKRFRRQSVRAGRFVDMNEALNAVSLLEDVDMSGLHRCVHVHSMLGDLKSFKEYYFEQRQLQLLSDLVVHGSMLEHHRTYLGHVAGFFITEERVLQSTDLVDDAAMRSLWGTAVSSIKSTLDYGFNETQNAAAMLVMKDYVLLTASCLARHHFDTSAIMAILTQYRERYHELLNTDVAVAVRMALRNQLRPLTVSTQQELEDGMTATGLPHALDASAPLPALPFEAPFTRALPLVVGAIEGYIIDSLQFLQGLLHSFELLATVREHRDRFVSRLLTDLYLNHTSRLAVEHAGLKPLLMMAADACCLAHVLQSLDDYTVVVMRGSEEHADEDLQLVARTQRRAAAASRAHAADAATADGKDGPVSDYTVAMVQAVAGLQEALQKQALAHVAATIRQHMSQAVDQNWAPASALTQAVSPYMEQLLIALREAVQLSARYLPEARRRAFARGMLAEVDRELMGLFSDTRFRAWNAHGMRRVCGDVDALVQFAEQHGGAGAGDCFARVDDLCAFLAKEDWQLAAAPAELLAAYPAMDPLLLVTALRKYEPSKQTYVDRIRKQSGAATSKQDVSAVAKDVEAAVADGTFEALKAKHRKS